jgi:hypothetical protein
MNSIVWLHDDCLRINHPVFLIAPNDSSIIYIWDNNYLKDANYSFKRLVFLYETLCELPLKIIFGDTLVTLSDCINTNIFTPSTNNLFYLEIIKQVDLIKNLTVVPDNMFVDIDINEDFQRFSQYWKKARKCLNI